MNIGYVISGEGRKTHAVLGAVAERARRQGIVLAGAIQPDDAGESEKCSIVLALLPDGIRRNVSFDLGPGVTGCRLDTAALDEAVMIVRGRLPGAQGLVVNKFGKQEAIGRGLVSAIVEACDRGLPVLVGVPAQWREAFDAFTDGTATELPEDEDHILDWLREGHAIPRA